MAAVMAMAVLAACQTGPTSTVAPEGRLNGARAVKILARTFVLRTPDGRPVRGAAVLVGGKVFQVGEDGSLALPASDLAKARADGAIVLVSEEFAPVRIQLEGSPSEVTLRPLTALGPAATLGAAGGRLVSADGATAVAFPARLTGADVDVTLSAYVPPTDGREAWWTAERKAFLAGLPAPTGTPRPGGGAACGQPLPCPPPAASIGLEIRADGPLAEGVVKVTYDLAAWLRGWDGSRPEPWVMDPGAWTETQIAQAKAAWQLKTTLGKLDATGDPAWRAELAGRYGLTWDGQRLTFDVRVGDQAAASGIARVEVEVFALLGVQLEVTVLSATKGTLPTEVGGAPGTGDAPAMLPPLAGLPSTGGLGGLGGAGGPGITGPGGLANPGDGPGVVANNGGGIVSNNGGSVISTGGNGVISTGGNGIVSNNGGGFTGRVMSPLEATGGAKYRLMAYTEVPLPDVALVEAVDLADGPYGPSDMTDGASDYSFTGMPASPALVFIRATAGQVTLRALAPAPGADQDHADLNTATTAITSWVLDELRTGRANLGQIRFAGYATDVAAIAPLLNQAEAETVATADVPTVAALVRSKFAGAGLPSGMLPTVGTLAGSGSPTWADGTGAAANFYEPVGQALDGAGNLYVADGTGRVRRIDPAGVVTSIAGNGVDGLADGTGTAAQFFQAWGAALAPNGDVIVGDHRNGAVRRVTPAGVVTTVAGDGTWANLAVDGPAGTAKLGLVAGVAVAPNGDVYFADHNNNAIRKVTPAGVVSTLAGSPGQAGHVDGPGAGARFNGPSGICLDGAGNVIVADRDNHAIRHVTPAGVVTTLAGGGGSGWVDAKGLAARFFQPRNVAVDPWGGVYVADTGNHRIRRIAPDGTVGTAAGTGAVGSADGTPAQATFNFPRGVIVGPDGTVYVADSSSNKIRRIR